MKRCGHLCTGKLEGIVRKYSFFLNITGDTVLHVSKFWCLLQNELAILEFIHCLVETLDRYFSNVCELDLMFNLEMVSCHPLRLYLVPFQK